MLNWFSCYMTCSREGSEALVRHTFLTLRRFADDGPCTLSQSGASEEGAISKAKRMMSEAATAQASIFMRGEGTDQR